MARYRPCARSCNHTAYWPKQKARPSTRVSTSQGRFFRSSEASSNGEAERERWAKAKVALLASRMSVFRYRVEGSAMCDQSAVPSRTKRALVNAAKLMVMAKIATQMPLREARSAARPGARTTGFCDMPPDCELTGGAIVVAILSIPCELLGRGEKFPAAPRRFRNV